MIYFLYFSFLNTIHLELKRQIRLHALVVPLKTLPDLRPQWSKSIPVFRPKRLKSHTLWGDTYLYSLCSGVPPPPPGSEAMTRVEKLESEVKKHAANSNQAYERLQPLERYSRDFNLRFYNILENSGENSVEKLQGYQTSCDRECS